MRFKFILNHCKEIQKSILDFSLGENHMTEKQKLEPAIN